MQWFAVYTKSKNEQLAADHLLRQGFNVFLPCYQRQRKHARKIDVVITALFPRYLFVELDENTGHWRSVEGTRGVSYLLRVNGSPVVIPNKLIDLLKTQHDEQGFVSINVLASFVKGQKVQIIDGCFSGQTAVFENMDDQQRVQLLLDFLSRPISIQLPIWAVEAI